MKKIVKNIGFGISLIVSLAAQLKAQQNRTVPDFTGIKVGDSFVVQLTQGDANVLTVDAPSNYQSQIITEVKNNILHISAEGKIVTDKPLTVTIILKSLNTIEINGSADVKSTNQLQCNQLSVESSGAGDVKLDVKATSIQVNVSGAGDVTLKGSTANLTADAAGAGELKASQLEAQTAKVIASGAGNVKVNVSQSIDASVSGAGSIIYKGNPSERIVNISGAGSVRESKSGNGEETAGDTTKFKLGNKKYIITEDLKGNSGNRYSSKDSSKNYNNTFKHWQGFDIGVNGFMDYKNSLNMPAGANYLELDYAKSIQFGLNLLEKDFHIYKNYINLVTGFGFDFNHYAFKNSTTLAKDSSNYLVASKDKVDYKKNSLNVSYIKVPLLIEVNTSKNPKKNFHIAGGLEFAYRIHSVLKQKYSQGNTDYKMKSKNDFNLEPFRYSAVARIGYNNITVFANYGLNRLFKQDQGPQVYPFTVGVTITM